ncbi:phosphatase PAP2 family protein [Tamlana fucoidanivorans]|uniref:Phosphatase PAP2 family protein n=1 Tax=Allotamlana fucoidanivorans TaxID=2583814 RepID=A0A5C4SCF8_9FLAO|nr:phosphatase PAP2 family protein [Tamlana fucoidanivorans]TNJ41246.1 phosphatase PAP2 family protein [Tamlana fucoidanivorans]
MKLFPLILCCLSFSLSFAQLNFNTNKADYFKVNHHVVLNATPNTNTTNNWFKYKSQIDQYSLMTSLTNDFDTESDNYLMMLSDSITGKPKWYKTDTGISLLVAGGLITAGTIMHFNTDFKVNSRDEINRYLPDFHNSIDDHTQYIPYLATYALDAFGIKSQHTTGRKLSTMATALGLNLIVVQSMKYSIAEPRPDGSSNNSFPSGHTTTAFMGAHIFHKEYKHRSPFYSIAAYTLATFTGIFRQLNNRHWISDVTAGAGIGIGATELAYFLNEGWWKEKGINEIEATNRLINESKPSFLGAKIGYATLTNTSGENEPGLEAKRGYRISFEGAYFFNKNFGLGAEIGFQSFPSTVTDDLQQKFNEVGYEVLPQSAGNRMYYFGPYYQIPFGKNAVGTKLHAGVISGPSSKVFVRELGEYDFEDNPPKEYVYADYDPKSSFSWGTGIYYKRVLSKNLSIGLYADYNWADLKYKVTYMNAFNNGEPTYFPKQDKTATYDSFALGANLNVMLW